jgi:hypothetical protein
MRCDISRIVVEVEAEGLSDERYMARLHNEQSE